MTRYQHTQALTRHFWNRWSKEYIHHLQQRVKWKQSQQKIQLDNLVLIKEDNLVPASWRIGRVVEYRQGLYPRMVTLKVATI